ncbi:MAG: hypothetical protein M1837_004734 [Sclerophora amabilis]|nr:MAG: hypothetical protein M1837_004734 [Sclerophora amabilis]
MRFPWSSQPSRDRERDPENAVNNHLRLTPTVEIPVSNNLKRKRRQSDARQSQRVDPRSKERNGRNMQINGINGIKVKDEDGKRVEQQLRNEERSLSRSDQHRLDLTRKGRMVKPAEPSGRAVESKRPDLRSQSPGQSLIPERKIARNQLTLCAVTTDPSSLTPLQQSIESQFSLEILLKHQELRLIEQELAKCQTALEQLRRCRMIPFSSPTSSTAATEVDNGTGQEHWAAAWDVSNGPYTRHYAKWLIPDPKFDGVALEEGIAQEIPVLGKTTMDGRATRGNLNEGGTTGGKGRLRGGPTGSKLHALSSGYSHAKDKAGPLIMKRSSDGQFVKLVCLDCERGDFSSAQGFINHCRIAHHRGFESHDAAANACGQSIEVDEAGNLVGDGEGGVGGTAAFVHPLIRSIPSPRVPSVQDQAACDHTNDGKSTGPRETNRMNSSKRRDEQPERSKKRSPSSKKRSSIGATDSPNLANSHFIPSSRTPHLSALMQRRGLSGDLGEMVGEAKKRFDFSVYSSSDEEAEEDALDESSSNRSIRQQSGLRTGPSHRSGADFKSNPYLPGVRVPVTARMSPAPLGRPNSSKGLNTAERRPEGAGSISSTTTSPSSATNSKPRPSTRRAPADVIPLEDPPPPNLSPTTLESTTAPSLVSDDGEYEVHTESESPSSTDPDDGHDVIQFEVEDHDDVGGSETTVTDPELAAQPSVKAALPKRTALRRRGSNGIRRSALRSNEERHVTFMSPEKSENGTGKKGGRRRGTRR